jgi:hypothetical protein
MALNQVSFLKNSEGRGKFKKPEDISLQTNLFYTCRIIFLR